MILFESNKSKISNVDNNDCQQDSRALYTIALNKPVNYQIFQPKMLYQKY